MDLIITAVQSLSPWEVLAVISAMAYLLLAVKESLWCWLFAFISTVIYTALFWHVSLLMDSALNVYYMAMAVFGWYQWTRGGTAEGGREMGTAKSELTESINDGSSGRNRSEQSNGSPSLPIRSLSFRQHVWIIAIIAVLSVLSGYYLSEHSSAVWPYVDSFTTWASVVTTYLVTQKYLQNWLYWVVIDAVSIPLYIDRGLSLTALLFVFYVIIAVFGYFKWKRHFIKQRTTVAA